MRGHGTDQILQHHIAPVRSSMKSYVYENKEGQGDPFLKQQNSSVVANI
jgi:hypothetical protein